MSISVAVIATLLSVLPGNEKMFAGMPKGIVCESGKDQLEKNQDATKNSKQA